MIKALEEVNEYNHHAISTRRHTLSTLERRHPNAVILVSSYILHYSAQKHYGSGHDLFAYKVRSVCGHFIHEEINSHARLG